MARPSPAARRLNIFRAMEQFEAVLITIVHGLRLTVESVGAIVIAVGVAAAIKMIVVGWLRRDPVNFTRVRLVLSRYLALALEFQLAGDILSTAIAPSWEQIGQLAAIAVIRTLLNFFLQREMKEEAAEIEKHANEQDRRDEQAEAAA